MQYLMSDIHGNANYHRLLDKVHFTSSDSLYILGDVIDRGTDALAILQSIYKPANTNIKLLMGNHELFALRYLEGNMSERQWARYGGASTINAIKELGKADRSELRDYLQHLPLYNAIESPRYGKCIITHSGLGADNLVFSEDRIDAVASIELAALKNLDRFLSGRDLHFMTELYLNCLDSFLIVGHVPCFTLNKNSDYHFYRNKYYMDIDAGSGYPDGKLGIYCVDTDEEIYV